MVGEILPSVIGSREFGVIPSLQGSHGPSLAARSGIESLWLRRETEEGPTETGCPWDKANAGWTTRGDAGGYDSPVDSTFRGGLASRPLDAQNRAKQRTMILWSTNKLLPSVSKILHRHSILNFWSFP